MTTVQAVLDLSPDLLGSPPALARAVEDRYLQHLTAPADELSREVYRRHLAWMRAELEGETPTPLERLLVDRVVACWLQAQHADKCMAGLEAEPHRLAQGEYHRQRQDRAHQRYLSAIKTLAQVRRLQRPALQVNIAQQQIVANGSSPAESAALDGRLMGGPGSSRWNDVETRDCVEHSTALPARWVIAHPAVHANGALSRWMHGVTWVTEPTADGGFRVSVTYPVAAWWRTSEFHLYRIMTAAGLRQYLWQCPGLAEDEPCDHRARALYLPPQGGTFACRKCHRLTYRSCRHDKNAARRDALQRAQMTRLLEESRALRARWETTSKQHNLPESPG
jgi:hypothetical protein